jgi:hypothetical protein
MIMKLNRLLLAATVIDGYGTELAQIQPPAYSPLKPNQREGRVRVAAFTKVFATEAAATDIALCELPAGARILSGEVNVSATTGLATLSFGLMAKDGSGLIDKANTVSDAVASVAAAAAITTTALVPIFATQALLRYYETEKPLFVTCTTAAAAMAGQTLKGVILYVVD